MSLTEKMGRGLQKMFSPMFNFKHTVTGFVADFKAVYRTVQNIRPDSSPTIAKHSGQFTEILF